MSDERQFDQTSFLRSLTHRPGVYRMLDAKHKVIYVGKARDLKKRVSSYFQRSHDSVKTAAMMELVANVEVTVTNTEAEALILEYNLIKQHKPRFNVLLRDDKSYPYIYVSTQQKFPRLQFHRGALHRLHALVQRLQTLGRIPLHRFEAAKLGVEFRPPTPPALDDLATGSEIVAPVEIVDGDRCGRFTSTVISGVAVAPSAPWMRQRRSWSR